MSKCYQVSLSEKVSVGKSVSASDVMVHRIEITNILPEKDMKKLLEKELVKRGWDKQEDGTYRLEEEETSAVLVWDLEKGQVTVSIDLEKSVEHTTIVHANASNEEAAKKQLERKKQTEQDKLDHAAADLQREMQQQVLKSLEEGEEGRRKELNLILEKVYGEALREKASTLGNIMSIDETVDGDDYELVIRIVDGA